MTFFHDWMLLCFGGVGRHCFLLLLFDEKELIQHWLDNLPRHTCRANRENVLNGPIVTPCTGPRAGCLDVEFSAWLPGRRGTRLTWWVPEFHFCALTLRWQALAPQCLDLLHLEIFLSCNNNNVLRQLSGTLNYSLIPKFKLCKAKEAENQCTFKVIRDHKWNSLHCLS